MVLQAARSQEGLSGSRAKQITFANAPKANNSSVLTLAGTLARLVHRSLDVAVGPPTCELDFSVGKWPWFRGLSRGPFATTHCRGQYRQVLPRA